MSENLATNISTINSSEQESRFIFRERNPEIESRLGHELSVHPVLARILVARGIKTADQATSFLSPSFRKDLPDPALMKNLPAAVELLLRSIELGELITVYSDFDVDGLTSGSQLYLYLSALGARVNFYTPNRFSDGYGLVNSAVEKLIEAGSQVVVTVDCGISSIDEITTLKRKGIKVVVLDHHIPQELPPADVVVDPAQDGCPFGEHQLCAAGLVWMMLILLRRVVSERGVEFGITAIPPDPKHFIDLAGIGTICDMVPLKGVNRLIALRGVEALKSTTRPGLIALKEVAGVKDSRLNAGQVGFFIGPRMNAAGRLGSARDVFELLTTTDINRARAIAEKIDKQNTERRAIEEGMRERCMKIIRAEQLVGRHSYALFDSSFHIGVIGIVAQRITELYYRPTAVMAPGEATIKGKKIAVVKGSVRSIRGFHVAEVLESLGELLLNGGGHAEAGGFSLLPERVREFAERFEQAAVARLSPEQLLRKVMIDTEVNLAEVDFELTTELGRLGPCGSGNPAPVLLASGLTVEGVQQLNGGHLKLRVTDGESSASAMLWKRGETPALRKGEQISLAFTPEINNYQGLASVQLTVKELVVLR